MSEIQSKVLFTNGQLTSSQLLLYCQKQRKNQIIKSIITGQSRLNSLAKVLVNRSVLF